MTVQRIVFLCGSLEPGRDGVGDYTRKLSEKLSGLGVASLLIALNDSYINAIQKEENNTVRIIRYPQSNKTDGAFGMAASEIENFSPDWISIQFVPFAYSSKGMPFGIGKKMAGLCRGKPVQVMFHELWLGMEINPELKFAVWGKIQRMIFLDLLKKVRPLCVHTHSDWYMSNLLKLGIDVKKLPLFSNIPLPQGFARKRVFNGLGSHPDKTVRFLIFGHISTGAPVEDFVNELKNTLNAYQLTCSLTCCGNNSGELERWKKAWYHAGFTISVRGVLDEKEISELIGQADVGIATTPLAVIEKSGSFMALTEHGLPVINVAEQKNLDKTYPFEMPYGLQVYKSGNLKEILEHVCRPEQGGKAEEIARRFLQSLQTAKEKGGNSA